MIDFLIGLCVGAAITAICSIEPKERKAEINYSMTLRESVEKAKGIIDYEPFISVDEEIALRNLIEYTEKRLDSENREDLKNEK